MSKTSIFLLIILFVATGIYFYVAAMQKNNMLPSLATDTPSPISPTQTTLSLINKPVPGEQTVNIGVQITSPTDNPNLIQLEIGYDPLVLTAIDVTPGTYFNHPVLLLDTINPRIGRISYALRCSPSTEASCVNKNDSSVAIFSFVPNPLAFKNETTVKLLPKTLLRTTTEDTIEAKLNGTTITLPTTIKPLLSPTQYP